MDLIRAVMLVVVGASALNEAHSAEATTGKATSAEQEAALLVQAMRMEASTRQALEAKSENAIKQGRADPAERECINKIDLGFVNQVYATALTNTLTREEIQQATAFFGSPAGQAYLQFSVAEQLRQGGVSVPQTELSDDTITKVLEFTASPAGDKLIVQYIHDTPEAKKEVTAKLLPELLRCKQATSR